MMAESSAMTILNSFTPGPFNGKILQWQTNEYAGLAGLPQSTEE
jgi:hypothetical protein